MVTLDSAGDGHSSHVYEVTGGKWQYLHSVPSFDPVGDYSEYVTQISGFKAGKHEGKITRLAAYGKPAYREIFDRFIRYNGAGSSEVRGISDSDAHYIDHWRDRFHRFTTGSRVRSAR